MGILDASSEKGGILFSCTILKHTIQNNPAIICGYCGNIIVVPNLLTVYMCICNANIYIRYDDDYVSTSKFSNIGIQDEIMHLAMVKGSTRLYECKRVLASWSRYAQAVLCCGFCKAILVNEEAYKCSNCNAEIVRIENISFTPQSTMILEEMAMTMPDDKGKTYNVRIRSPFILTTNQVKEKLGIGYKVLEVGLERDFKFRSITDVDSAVDMIIQTGFHALVRANHPDLGGDAAVVAILTRAKKELAELVESVR